MCYWKPLIGLIFLSVVNVRCEKEDITPDLPTCECVKEVWLKTTPLRVRGYPQEVMLMQEPVECQPEVEKEVIEASLEGIRYFKIVCDERTSSSSD